MRRLLRGASALALFLLAAGCAPAPGPAPAPEAEAPAAAPAPQPEPEPEAEPGPPEPDEWVVLEIDAGEIWINLFEEQTPEHAENFKKLVRQGWYDGSPFHRVLPGVIAQGGGRWAEDGRNTTDVGYDLAAEIRPEMRHVRGAVAAARVGDGRNPRRRSSGSQFYICLSPQHELDRQYTIFGQVILGMEVAQQIAAAPPGKDGLMTPDNATVLRRAWLRPATEPGSAAPQDHSDHDH